MARQKKTTYAMLTSERRFQIEEEIQARPTTNIAAGLPWDSPEPEEEEEEEEEEEPAPMEMVDPEEDEAEQPEEELLPAVGFDMDDTMVEFAVAQAVKMVEQHAILESIQEEAYVEANR